MAEMNKRERVMRTVRFEETDRVPLYDILQNDAIIEHYSGRKLTVKDGDWIVGVAAGRALDMTRMVSGPQEPGENRNSEGFLVKQERWTSWFLERPFNDLPGAVEWVKERIREAQSRTFDSTHVDETKRYIENKWAAFAEGDPTGRNDPAVLVIESGAGLTEMYHTVGMDLFVELMVEVPDLLAEWLEARNECELRRVTAIADPHWIPIALTYDDIAHKTSTLFSPKWLRQHWLPGLKRLVDAWHTRDVACLFHSDGNLWIVLDDLVEAGVDGLNPLEILADMTVKKVRDQYPNLFLAGGIDVSQLLTLGTPEEVRATCRQAIADTGGRGFFMGSSTELHWDVKLENATAMFESAWEMCP